MRVPTRVPLLLFCPLCAWESEVSSLLHEAFHTIYPQQPIIYTDTTNTELRHSYRPSSSLALCSWNVAGAFPFPFPLSPLTPTCPPTTNSPLEKLVARPLPFPATALPFPLRLALVAAV